LPLSLEATPPYQPLQLLIFCFQNSIYAVYSTTQALSASFQEGGSPFVQLTFGKTIFLGQFPR